MNGNTQTTIDANTNINKPKARLYRLSIITTIETTAKMALRIPPKEQIIFFPVEK